MEKYNAHHLAQGLAYSKYSINVSYFSLLGLTHLCWIPGYPRILPERQNSHGSIVAACC